MDKKSDSQNNELRRSADPQKGILTDRDLGWLDIGKKEVDFYDFKDGNVLDLGTGKRVTIGGAQRVTKHIEDFIDKTNLVAADATKLPYKSGFFKHVVCGWSVPYYYNGISEAVRNETFGKWIDEMYRVLEKGGLLHVYPARHNDAEDFYKHKDKFKVLETYRMPQNEVNRNGELFYRVTLQKI